MLPIYLVHDLIPITHPDFARAGEDIRHCERMLTVLKTGRGVIGNSWATLNQLQDFASSEGVSMPPSVIAWLGSDPLSASSYVEPPRQPTFVTLGTIEARKNHGLLLNVWARLVERLGSEAPQLLIIGQRGWEAEEVFDRLDNDVSLKNHVVELGDCSDKDLARHLRSACAMLFPSYAEGFGLPLVEALDARVPVIASELPVFRELCGEIPTYLKPDDEPSWEAAILDYARAQSETRAAQIDRMRGYHSPTWSQHFATVEEFLSKLN